MNRIVIVLVGMAAIIYIGQFAWSFKVEADRVEAAEQQRYEEIKKKYLRKSACVGDFALRNPDICSER